MRKTRKRTRNARNFQSPASTSASGSSYSSSSGTATPPTNCSTGRRNGVSTPSNSSKTAGRNTQNSKGHRGRKPVRKTPVPKGSNGRGRKMKGKDTTNLQSPHTYKADDGEVYNIGDFAYVDSQQAELPFHICIIRDFKLARKDSVIAEVKWFYRVSELPEAVYLLLMEDRKKSPESSLYENPRVRNRELFMAYNIDTHPASLFKGKCTVKEFTEVQDHLAQYMDKPDTFFYSHGYKPESRRLTLSNEESYVPHSQQAVLPECLCPDPEDKNERPTGETTSYKPGNDRAESFEEMVWKPRLTDDELLMYLRAARSIALHAGVCMTGYIADGYLAASADETTQRAFDVLHKNDHNTERALQDLVKRPTVGRLINKKNWSKESTVLFGKGMRQFGKNFSKIRKELLPEKEISELSEYYYYWKKTTAGLSSRSTRRQRKMTHIRLSRTLLKQREETPEKEYMDWESCDEEDPDFEDGDKIKARSFYACRHCYSQGSTNWHHAGPDKAILCDNCRLYFQRYGCLKLLTEADKKSPPDFMFKDFHESPPPSSDFITSSSGTTMASPPGHTLHTTPTSTGRKTRNSNGSRATSSRPGLRSGKKNYSKSDTDEEDEGEASAESSESSGEDDVVPVHVSKQKSLQARRSILENIDDNLLKPLDEPPAKRAKREETITTLSEEEGSADSTNGEGDQDSSQKSPASNKSPGQSSTASSGNPGDDENSPHSSQSSVTNAYSIPQQFKWVGKDHDSSCARTDLVFVHPPAEEKKMATSTSKVLPQMLPGSSAYGGTGGHSLETPGPSANVKVPIITPHAPQLPIGPSSFGMGFPLPYPPMTPLSAGPGNGQEVAAMAAAAAVAGAAQVIPKREMGAHERGGGAGEHIPLALWQQQQQQQHQQQQLQILAAQKHLAELHQQQQQHHPHLLTLVPPQPTPTTVPLHPHHHPPFQAAGGVPTTAHAPHSIEHSAQHFNFLSAEELAARQQMALRMGIPVEHLGVFPQPFPGTPPAAAMHPALLEQLAAASRRNEEHAVSAPTPTGMIIPAAQAPPFIPAGAVPGMPAASMEQLAVQQQQAMLAAMGGVSAQQVMEFQQQCEMVIQQCQKDPSLYQNPQVQVMLQQRELLARSLQEQSLMQHQNLMQRRQQEMLIHQQQAELQKQFVLSRPPAPDEVHSRNRPGVIVQSQARSGGH